MLSSKRKKLNYEKLIIVFRVEGAIHISIQHALIKVSLQHY